MLFKIMFYKIHQPLYHIIKNLKVFTKVLETTIRLHLGLGVESRGKLEKPNNGIPSIVYRMKAGSL